MKTKQIESLNTAIRRLVVGLILVTMLANMLALPARAADDSTPTPNTSTAVEEAPATTEPADDPSAATEQDTGVAENPAPIGAGDEQSAEQPGDEPPASDVDDGAAVEDPAPSAGPANNRPAGCGDAYTVDQDTTLDIGTPGVLANDGDAEGDTLSVSQTSQPHHGTLTRSTDDGAFTFAPDAAFVGTDSFTYSVSDGTISRAATVTITITAATPPTATATPEPTETPTDEPTEEPTQTATPTESPTAQPTTEPTGEPTGGPDDQGNGTPTPDPSDDPAETPTEDPDAPASPSPSPTKDTGDHGQDPAGGQTPPTADTDPDDETRQDTAPGAGATQTNEQGNAASLPHTGTGTPSQSDRSHAPLALLGLALLMVTLAAAAYRRRYFVHD